MKAAIAAMLTLALLIVVTTACSSPERKLVGEWQSTKPESVHFNIGQDAAPTGPAGEGSGWHTGFLFTENGKTYSFYWAIGTDSSLLLSSGGIGGNYSLSAIRRKIFALTSDKLVVEWGIYPSPTRVIEFHRVK